MNLKTTPLLIRRLRSWLEDSARLLPHFFLIKHFKSIEAIIFLSIVLCAGYLLFQLFWGQGAPLAATPAQPVGLSRDKVDVLELWIEERQAVLDKGLSLPTREYFVRDVTP